MARLRKLALGAALPALVALPATAQPDDRPLRERLRACAGIAEVAARVACYDAISADEPAASSAPAAAPAGFGGNQLRARAAGAAEAEAIEATVADAVERQPGIHLLTLEDGAQWQFVESVPASYSPPRRGSTVEIRGASLGSYQLRFRGQAAVRVRRVR